MVQQTRRVVESYIFYKLQNTFSLESFIASGADIKKKQEITKIFNKLSLHHTTSSIDLTIQKLACEFEKQYQETFPDLLEELRFVFLFKMLVLETFNSIGLFFMSYD